MESRQDLTSQSRPFNKRQKNKSKNQVANLQKQQSTNHGVIYLNHFDNKYVVQSFDKHMDYMSFQAKEETDETMNINISSQESFMLQKEKNLENSIESYNSLEKQTGIEKDDLKKGKHENKKEEKKQSSQMKIEENVQAKIQRKKQSVSPKLTKGKNQQLDISLKTRQSRTDQQVQPSSHFLLKQLDNTSKNQQRQRAQNNSERQSKISSKNISFDIKQDEIFQQDKYQIKKKSNLSSEKKEQNQTKQLLKSESRSHKKSFDRVNEQRNKRRNSFSIEKSRRQSLRKDSNQLIFKEEKIPIKNQDDGKMSQEECTYEIPQIKNKEDKSLEKKKENIQKNSLKKNDKEQKSVRLKQESSRYKKDNITEKQGKNKKEDQISLLKPNPVQVKKKSQKPIKSPKSQNSLQDKNLQSCEPITNFEELKTAKWYEENKPRLIFSQEKIEEHQKQLNSEDKSLPQEAKEFIRKLSNEKLNYFSRQNSLDRESDLEQEVQMFDQMMVSLTDKIDTEQTKIQKEQKIRDLFQSKEQKEEQQKRRKDSKEQNKKKSKKKEEQLKKETETTEKKAQIKSSYELDQIQTPIQQRQQSSEYPNFQQIKQKPILQPSIKQLDSFMSSPNLTQKKSQPFLIVNGRPELEIQKKVKQELSTDIPIGIKNVIKENEQIMFEVEWAERNNGHKPDNSKMSFEDLRDFDPANLIDFLTYHMQYINKMGLTATNNNLEPQNYRPVTLDFTPKKVLKTFMNPHLRGPSFEVEYENKKSKIDKKMVYYEDLKVSHPYFLLDFYKSKITFEV